MPKKNRANKESQGESSNLEQLIFEAMKVKGWVLPETEEEVRAAESNHSEKWEELPPHLVDPYAVLRRARERQTTVVPLAPPESREVEDNLARAAREGRPISADIEQKMKVDRQVAEQSGDDADKDS